MLVFIFFFFFFNDTATTEIYTLSLHDALPILFWPRHVAPPCGVSRRCGNTISEGGRGAILTKRSMFSWRYRSEEHTSELQSHNDLVCRLLLEKKKKHKSYSCCDVLHIAEKLSY